MLIKDYFIKSISLDEIIHQVIMQNKDYFLTNNIIISTNNLKHVVATDEKWVIFVINQIINNSIKYMDKKDKEIIIQAKKLKNKVLLEIIDNGVGILTSDLPRVFEKGFTGSNRKNIRSTGMGLYLANKICSKLGLEINIVSKYKEGTKISIGFPNSNYNKMD